MVVVGVVQWGAALGQAGGGREAEDGGGEKERLHFG